jgi:hypothetical protein
MIQLTSSRYEVVRGEKVTITVTPVKVAPRVTAQQNEQPLDNVGSESKPRFEFKVDEVPGNTHFVPIEFDFVPNDDPGAFFRIDVAGSRGGDFRDVKRVKKNHANHTPILRFEVPRA